MLPVLLYYGNRPDLGRFSCFFQLLHVFVQQTVQYIGLYGLCVQKTGNHTRVLLRLCYKWLAPLANEKTL